MACNFKWLLFCFLFVSCIQPESSRTEFVLGTFCSVTIFDRAKKSVYDDIFARFREIENLMSVNIAASDVSRINAAAGIEPVQVHEDVFNVIEKAIYYAELTGGAFDPSIGPLVALWGIGTDNPRVPSHDEIEEILPLVNWQNIELNPQTQSVYLKYKGMKLDLGGIAKGFAADEAAEILKKAGIQNAIIDLSGNILVLGEKKDRTPWRVGIQNPNEGRGIISGIIQISAKNEQQSIVTSGVYERFFEEEERRFHHIFSPSHGYPAENGLSSVTVVAHNSMDADALSTAVFVMGYEKGRQLIETLDKIEAVFIFNDLSIQKTQGADFHK